MDLEKNADEIAALSMIFAGITMVMTMVFATLFYDATMEKDTLDSIGTIFVGAGAIYLFGKSKPK